MNPRRHNLSSLLKDDKELAQLIFVELLEKKEYRIPAESLRLVVIKGEEIVIEFDKEVTLLAVDPTQVGSEQFQHILPILDRYHASKKPVPKNEEFFTDMPESDTNSLHGNEKYIPEDEAFFIDNPDKEAKSLTYIKITKPVSILTIDPTTVNSNPKHAKILRKLLEHLEQQKEFVIYQDQSYRFVMDDRLFDVRMSHTLVYQKKWNGYTEKYEPRYSVGLLEDKKNVADTGKGLGGDVLFMIDGTLAPNRENDEMSYKREKNRRKEMTVFNFESNNETPVRLVALKENLTGKKATVDETKNEAYLAVKTNKGDTLASIIDAELENKKVLKVSERIKLSINLLKALKEIQDMKDIHGDIKAENIYVDENFDVKFAGLRISVTVKPKSIEIDTPELVDPEVFSYDRRTSQKTDIEAVGSVLSYIWQSGIKTAGSNEDNSFDRQTPHILSRRFMGIDDDEFGKLQTKLDQVIGGLTKIEDDNHEVLKRSMALLEEAYDDHHQLSPEERKAREIGRSLNEELNRIAKGRSGTKAKPVDFMIVVTGAIYQIGSTESELMQFIDATNIKAFKGLKNKGALLKKLIYIKTSFEFYSEELLKKMQEVESGLHIADKIGINETIKKSLHWLLEDGLKLTELKSPLTIDELVKINERYERKVPTINARYAEFEKLPFIEEAKNKYKKLRDTIHPQVYKQLAILDAQRETLNKSESKVGRGLATEMESLSEQIRKLVPSDKERPVTVSEAANRDSLEEITKKLADFTEHFNKNIAITEFQHVRRLERVSSYKNILRSLGATDNPKEEHILELKNDIKTAIKNYIMATLTTKNIRKSDRAVSQRRYKDINDILAIINTEGDEKQLIQKIDQRVSQFEHAWFGSALRDNINNAINPHRNESSSKKAR